MKACQSNDIAFLGCCERAAYIPITQKPPIIKWNILGLRDIILSYIYPSNIAGLTFVFAFRFATTITAQQFNIVDESGAEVGSLKMDFVEREEKPSSSEVALERNTPWMRTSQYGWTLIYIPLKGYNIIIQKPGRYYLNLITERGPQTVGEIIFAVLNPPPLTIETIAAIKSDPNAAKYVRIEIGCKKCPSKLKVYTSIERGGKIETEGWQWYEDIPEEYLCECGSTRIKLDPSSTVKNVK
jgi:hypothetical protein